MFRVQIFISFCLLIVRLTSITAEITWENCPGGSNSVHMINLTVSPNPIVLPGSISVGIGLRIDEDLESPIKAELTLSRKVLFGYISVPCVSGIGSCTYDDICKLCPQCGCPLKAGDHALTLPFTIEIGSWALMGNYKGKVDIITPSGHKGCITISNVHIASSS